MSVRGGIFRAANNPCCPWAGCEWSVIGRITPSEGGAGGSGVRFELPPLTNDNALSDIEE